MNRLAIMLTVVWLPIMVCPTPAADPTPAEIQTAIRQLGNEKFVVRERATKLLIQAGPAAESAIREILYSSNPEVAQRARDLMERITYRVGPDTPAEIVALIQKFKTGSFEEQAGAIREMVKFGSKSHPYIMRLIDSDVTRQKPILEYLASDDWKILMVLMTQGDEKIVEFMLDRAMAVGIEEAQTHDAVLRLWNGQLDPAIAKLRSEVAAQGGPRSARRLATLYRLKRDWDGVIWAAERGEASDLIRLSLMEQGRWNDLLTNYTPVPLGGLHEIQSLGLLASYQRLAGNVAGIDKTFQKIADYANGPKKDSQPMYAARALLINERNAEAMDLLTKHEQWMQAAELAAAEGKYAEALALSEKATVAETQPNYVARMAHINLLHRFGEVEKAREWLDRLNKEMASVTHGIWLERQIELEFRLGRVDVAERRLLELIEREGASYLGHAFEGAFPKLGERGDTIWRLIRFQNPTERTDESLKRLRRIENQTIAPDEFTALLRNAVPAPEWMPKNSSPSAFDHLASVVWLFGRADLAEQILANPLWKDAPASSHLRLAETLADAGKWPEAAKAYRKIWEADRSSALPYFLYGASMAQAGAEAEGKKIMATAHRMLLGADRERYYFLDALQYHGFAADADREVQVLAQLCSPANNPYYHGVALDRAARSAQRRGDYLAAAAMHERNLLRLLAIGPSLRSIGGYIQMTSLVHALRARGLLNQGKKEEAFREMEIARLLDPVQLEIPILLVADLEKHGEKERAAQLFQTVYGSIEQGSRAFPGCAEAHNQLAWMAARCRRQLDDAFMHAKKAVELAPLSASYLDTLAEVSFQRGDTATAIDLMKKCLKMPSANTAFYRQQLVRFKKGDPRVEPADE